MKKSFHNDWKKSTYIIDEIIRNITVISTFFLKFNLLILINNIITIEKNDKIDCHFIFIFC